MPLNSRDLWIILRARDLASQTLIGTGKAFGTLGAHATAADRALYANGQRLEQVGKIATTAGIGIAALGIAGLAAVKNFTNAAKEFERSAALASTQVHNGTTSVQELEGISMRVAKSIPVPIESLNAALFDIFSSTDIKVKDSEKVLKSFSIAAVAGQDDIINVGRAAIAILNSWDEPLSNLNHIFDVQFKMVQLGVGTYQQFASVIGRAIPSVRAAGQSFEFLAGTMAFLTRRGQSTAFAAVAIARLTDLFRRPAAFEGLRTLGNDAIKVADAIGKKLDPASRKALKGLSVNALDASGHLRPINQILTEMAPAFAKLNVPERAGLFKAIFGGQGTIQARRFFDLAIDRTKELNRFISEVGHSSGATKNAFDKMSETFAAKSQILHNNWMILKITLGNLLLPQVTKFIEKLTRLVEWFNNLSPKTKTIVAKLLLFGSIAAVVGGVLLTLVGVLAMFAGSLLTIIAVIGPGVIATFLGFAAPILIIIAAVTALAIVIIVKHKVIWAFIQKIWHAIANFFISLWGNIVDIARTVWGAITSYFSDQWNKIKDLASSVWGAVANFFSTLWNDILNIAKAVWNAIFVFLQQIWHDIRVALAIFIALMVLPWQVLWHIFGHSVKVAWQGIVAALQAAWNFIAGWLTSGWNDLVRAWRIVWGAISTAAKVAWSAISTAAKVAWNAILNFLKSVWAGLVIIFNVFKFAISAAWNTLWGFFNRTVVRAWQVDIFPFLRNVWNAIRGFFTRQFNDFKAEWGGVWKRVKDIFNTAWGAIKTAWNTAFSALKTAFQATVSFLGTVWNRIKSLFASPVNWVIDNVINQFIKTLNTVSKKLGVALNIPLVGHVAAGEGNKGPGRPSRPGVGFQAGGVVPGFGLGDRIPALLEPGEFVMRRRAVKSFGAANLMAINKFAQGGIVGAAHTIGNSLLSVVDPVKFTINTLTRAISGAMGSARAGTGAIGSILSGGVKMLSGVLFKVLKDKIGSFFGGIGDLLHGVPSNVTGNVAIGKAMAAAVGWTGAQWNALFKLWQGESGWRNTAQNPVSTAFGIAQFLDSTWATVGARKTSDPRAQIAAGIRYIQRSYGTPVNAYGAWLSRSPHWYDRGGVIREPIIGFGRSGQMYGFGGSGTETVVPGSGGQGTTINVYTQELNPRVHAAQLGWELRRLGVI